MKAICTLSRGADIAEADLLIRGTGELLGEEQSGYNEFSFVDLHRDGDLIAYAHKLSKKPID
ncbi:hypothetical protein CSB45_15725 [candidate division KSB3 bacterium]|uniref:ATP-dependent DNA helicase RecG domain-containing protein n=1 Tax=candidate division KSB3 bacterium TaxID=2044937 RepID=A0A2G6E0E5_9BACT|nr:MAG: hypothetical protein CSB45_15725 [candidate division KSB3 bacterium]